MGFNGPPDDIEDAYLQRKLRRLPTFARELIAGGVAGGLAKTCVAPLERTKIIFQTRGGAMTVGSVLRQICHNEGVTGLFRGNTASVLRVVPYAAIHFGSYEYFKRGILGLAQGSSPSAELQHPVWDLLAGSMSGATAVLMTYPLDLIRTRLAWSTADTSSAAAHGSRHAIITLFQTSLREEGPLGLYRGVIPTLLGILPYAGLKFYVYQALKNQYRLWAARTTVSEGGSCSSMLVQQQQRQQAGMTSSTALAGAASADAPAAAAHQLSEGGEPLFDTKLTQPQQQPQQPMQQQEQLQQEPQKLQVHTGKLPIGATLVFGGIAGLVAQTVTYPLDVIRRQMQVSGLQRSAGSTSGNVQSQHALSSSSSSDGGGAHSMPAAQPRTAAATASGSARASHMSSYSSQPIAPSVEPRAVAVSAQCSQQAVALCQSCSSGLAQPVHAAAGSHGLAAGSSSHSSTGPLGTMQHPHAASKCKFSPVAAQPVAVGISSWHWLASPAALSRQHCLQISSTSIASGSSSSNAHVHHRRQHIKPNMSSVTRRLIAEGGVKALCRGLSINYMKVVPSTAIGFTIYDALKSYLGLTSTL